MVSKRGDADRRAHDRPGTAGCGPGRPRPRAEKAVSGEIVDARKPSERLSANSILSSRSTARLSRFTESFESWVRRASSFTVLLIRDRRSGLISLNRMRPPQGEGCSVVRQDEAKPMEATNQPTQSHHHHWIIATANGPRSEGICKYCHAHRDFPNWLAETDYMGREERRAVGASSP